MQVPYSAGTQPPQQLLPLGATDCHHHIFDPKYPEKPGLHPLPDAYKATPPDLAAYRQLQKRLGLTRSVFVAPSNYGDDNSLLLDAIRAVGTDKARGVAIVSDDISDTELHELHRGGIRGIRIYLAKDRAPTREKIASIGTRLASLDWHLQLVGARDDEVFVSWEPVLAQLPCKVVIDHFGYAPQPGGAKSATAGVLHRLLDNGKTFVKLSGVYIQSKEGYPDYSDVDELAVDLICRAPERLVWGSDWPHVGATVQLPDGAKLIDQLFRWAPTETLREQILVSNPTHIYWQD